MFLLLITKRIAIKLFSFNKILLFIKKLLIKKLAFDGFYPLLVVLKKKSVMRCVNWNTQEMAQWVYVCFTSFVTQLVECTTVNRVAVSSILTERNFI